MHVKAHDFPRRFTQPLIVRAYCKMLLSRYLPFFRSARYSTLRKRR